MSQGDLLAEAGMARAELNADELWVLAARKVVWQLIQERVPFTTDDVWARLDGSGVQTHERRALGAVMRSAAKAGWIVATGEYFKSDRPECHGRPVALWLPQDRATV